MVANSYEYTGLLMPTDKHVNEKHELTEGNVQGNDMRNCHSDKGAASASIGQLSTEESGSEGTGGGTDEPQPTPPAGRAKVSQAQAGGSKRGAKTAAVIAAAGGGLLKKTSLCTFFQAKGKCPRGKKCQFAHGEKELRHKPNLFKTEICHAFSSTGKCRYGRKCSFAHTTDELRANAPSALPPPTQLAVGRPLPVGVPFLDQSPQWPRPVGGAPATQGIPSLPNDISQLSLELDLMRHVSKELQSRIGTLERFVGDYDDAASVPVAIGGGSPSMGSLGAFEGYSDGLPSHDFSQVSTGGMLTEDAFAGGQGFHSAAPDTFGLGSAVCYSF